MQWDAKLAIFKTTSMSARISDFARAAYIRSFHTVRLDGWQLFDVFVMLSASKCSADAKKVCICYPFDKTQKLTPSKTFFIPIIVICIKSLLGACYNMVGNATH